MGRKNARGWNLTTRRILEFWRRIRDRFETKILEIKSPDKFKVKRLVCQEKLIFQMIFDLIYRFNSRFFSPGLNFVNLVFRQFRTSWLIPPLFKSSLNISNRKYK